MNAKKSVMKWLTLINASIHNIDHPLSLQIKLLQIYQ